jgi:5-methylcytosine-specific restriction protein B
MVPKKTEFDKYAALLNFSPNLIIQGVPGSGKTYTARKIVESYEKNHNRPISFEALEKQGRARLITFHNSYTYEHFIEGINPLASGNSNVPFYKPGILMQMSVSASLEILKTGIRPNIRNTVNLNSKIWKVSLGYRKTEDRVYRECKKSAEIVVGWLEKDSLEGRSYNEIYAMLEARRGNDEPKLSSDVVSINSLVNEMKKGDFVLIYDKPGSISDIGIITGDYFHDSGSPYPHKRKVSWYKEFSVPVDITEYDNNSRFSMKTIYELEKLNFADLRVLLSELKMLNTEKTSKINPYYLVIDELNRGRLIDIFGEAVSLLDKDKREKYKSVLLYSNKAFSLPANLFLICTMAPERNYGLDPVIQRRFATINIFPEPELLNNQIIKNCKINPGTLLKNLNRRIAAGLNSDFLVGHAYFSEIREITGLFNTFYFKIIPLLLNYLSGDFSLLKTIIGAAFFDGDNKLVYMDTTAEKDSASPFESALLWI